MVIGASADRPRPRGRPGVIAQRDLSRLFVSGVTYTVFGAAPGRRGGCSHWPQLHRRDLSLLGVCSSDARRRRRHPTAGAAGAEAPVADRPPPRVAPAATSERQGASGPAGGGDRRAPCRSRRGGRVSRTAPRCGSTRPHGGATGASTWSQPSDYHLQMEPSLAGRADRAGVRPGLGGRAQDRRDHRRAAGCAASRRAREGDRFARRARGSVAVARPGPGLPRGSPRGGRSFHLAETVGEIRRGLLARAVCGADRAPASGRSLLPGPRGGAGPVPF